MSEITPLMEQYARWILDPKTKAGKDHYAFLLASLIANQGALDVESKRKRTAAVEQGTAS